MTNLMMMVMMMTTMTMRTRKKLKMRLMNGRNTCVIMEVGADSDEDERDDIQFVPSARTVTLALDTWPDHGSI